MSILLITQPYRPSRQMLIRVNFSPTKLNDQGCNTVIGKVCYASNSYVIGMYIMSTI